MAPNSRPPLTSVTSRLRKSFEGKRSKSEVTSPISTNGFISQDPEAFRNAIDEAISSETFQTAIAANLARLIKPSIKDALDTLQPVVEAVYSHEVLLRKTNRSVEDILIRLDTTQSRRESIAEIGSNGNSTPTPGTPTSPRRRRVSESSNPRDDEQFKTSLEKSNKRTVATLAELSNVIDGNNKKIAEAVAGVQTIQTSLIPTKEALDSLRAFSEESNTKTAVMQAQLDQLQADIGSIIESVKSGMGQNQGTRDIDATADHPAFAAHTLKLDAISADIGSLRVQSDFAGRIGGINDAIVALKGSVDASANTNIENFGSLATHLAQVLNGVEGHGENLAAIKDASSHNPAILEAVQQSNESHAFHAKVLGEIKEQSLSTPSDAAPTTTLTDPKLTEDLDGLKADLQALKENIEVGFASSNENVVGLSSKIETIVTTVEEHRAADQSSEVLAAVQRSNDSHTSHAEVLEGIRSQGGNLPPVIYDSNFSALEEKIVALQEMLKSHGGTLDEIKGANISTSREIMPAEGDTSADFTTIINTLNSHTDMLCEIKDDVSAEILTALHDIGQSQATQSSLLAEIREADVSEEILTALHTSNESHSGHSAALEQLHAAMQASNDSHAAHTAILDELKSTRSFESAEPVERVLPSESSNTGVLETQIAALTASLEEHKSALVEIKEATNASNESHTAHATALDELKSRPVFEAQASSENANAGALEAQISAIAATLEEHKAALAEIKDATNASNESHTSHTASLATIQEATALSNESHATHTASLEAIKELTSASNDHHTSHATVLDDLKSRAVEPIPAGETSNLADLQVQIGSIAAALDEHKTALGAIHEAASASNDSHAAHATILDELRSRPAEPAVNEGGSVVDLSGLESQVSTIITTLEEQKAALSTIQDTTTATHDLQASQITALNEIKEAAADSTELHHSYSAKLDEVKEVTSGLGDFHTSHAAILSEIKETTSSLAESHVTHTTTLEDIKSRSLEAPVPAEGGNFGALEAQIGIINSTLEEIKGHTSGLNDFHTSHAASLSEIKESHVSHANTLNEIRDATTASNEAHLSNTVALADLKERSAQAAETVPQDVTNSPDFPAMESHLQSIISTLELHNSKLAEIEEAAKSAEVLTAVKESHTLITTNHDLIAAQAPILESIKDASLTTDILSSISELKAAVEESKTGFAAHGDLVKELHSDTKSSHSDLAAAIGGLALGGVAGAGAAALAADDGDSKSAEILEEIKAVRAAVEASSTSTDGDAKSAEIFEEVKAIRTVVENSSTSIDATKESVTSIASQIDINHTTVTTSITTLSDELKAEIDATGTQISESISILTSDVNAIDVAPLNTSIESCNASVADLKSSVKALSTSVDSTDSKLNALSSGVHFNDLGIDQLKEHTTVPERRESIPEAAWFGKKSSPVISRAVIDHSDTDVETEKEYNYLSPVAEESPVQDTTPLPNMAEVVNEKTVEPEEGESGDSHASLAAGVGALAIGGVTAASIATLAANDDEKTLTQEDSLSKETVQPKEVIAEEPIIEEFVPKVMESAEETQSETQVPEPEVIEEIVPEPETEPVEAEPVEKGHEETIIEEEVPKEATESNVDEQIPEPEIIAESIPEPESEIAEAEAAPEEEPVVEREIEEEKPIVFEPIESEAPTEEAHEAVVEAEEAVLEAVAKEEIEPEEPAVIESIENPEEAAEAPLPPIEEAEAVPEEVVDSRAIKASPVPSKTQSIKDDDDELDENPLSLPVSRQHSPEPPIVKGSSFAEPEEELPKTPVVHEFEEATPAPEQEEQEAEADPELEAEPAPSFEPTPASEEEEPPVPAVKKNEELVEPTPEVETKEADIDEESAPMAKIEEPKEETDPQGKEIDSEGPATPSPTPAVNLDEENEHTTAAESKGKSIDLDLESEGPLSPPLATPPLDSFGESAEVDDSPDATEPESASASQSTSAIASPSSPSFPLSPTSGEKKGKKGKKEKKEKKVKEKKGGKKKEKVPFVMDGDEPED